MSESKDLKEFPDLSNKLAAPSKKSLFERQKAEAEAKRIREEAETAAVYEDFVKSFEDEGGIAPGLGGIGRIRPSNAFESKIPSGPPKRHFTPGTRNSGPGSLGIPTNVSKKRTLDGSKVDREKERGIFAFEDSPPGPVDAATAFRTSDDEDEKAQDSKPVDRAAPRPTLQLSSLPPGTSPAVIKSLLPSNLTVDAVRVIPPAGPGSSASTERKSMSAIVTLAKDSPASDLDAAVSSLQNKYLGWGYNLSLSRHLSSAALGSTNSSSAPLHSALASLPFGAQAMSLGPGAFLSRAPPPGSHRGGFAPPTSYNIPDQGIYGRVPPVQVKVAPPSDLRQLKLIHKTLEALLTHGPEFEALLMSRPEVQREEKWAWLWNPRSTGGVWYRWRLWEILTGGDAKRSQARQNPSSHRIFDAGVPWAEPEDRLPFEFTTNFAELISDSEYNSSDEDDSGDEDGLRKRRQRFHEGSGPSQEASLVSANEDQSYLNPLHRAKLTHLLARLPTSTAKLRKGDVARVTAFAITHAGLGADEVVNMLISNVMRPYNWSRSANPDLKGDEADAEVDPEDGDDKKEAHDHVEKKDSKDDTSSSTLIALHLISDILSASSTSGVRHAWRYRSLFEGALATRRIFACLGRMEKDLGWGRLRAEKWRRSVGGVLQLWEGWCVFPAATQEHFVEEFNHPPLTQEETAAELARKAERSGIKDSAKSKWKSVAANSVAEGELMLNQDVAMDIDGEPMDDDDIDGAPMEDVDGDPLEDVDGEPMEDDLNGEPMHNKPPEHEISDQTIPEKPHLQNLQVSTATLVEQNAPQPRRQRPKAVDMFADSDEE